MNILFISSGNSPNGISPIVKSQGESLKKRGVEVTYYTIKGRGFRGYLRNIGLLRKYIRQNTFDVYHAHYSLSAVVAALAGAKPLVVSLMGSDVKAKSYFKFMIKLFDKLFWSATVVKSEDMKSSLRIKNTLVIPNGVDLEKFRPLDRKECKTQLGWDTSKKQVLFAANPVRREKNFALAKEAFHRLLMENTELKVLKNVPNELMPVYHNAADVVLLTSLWEGSPNVIKEAMACNTPVVSSDVGDVKKVFGHTEGCYLTTFERQDVAEKIKKALTFSKNKGRTQGRERLMELGLDAETVARNLMKMYGKIIGRHA